MNTSQQFSLSEDLGHPRVLAIIGQRRQGKSTLGYFLLSVYMEQFNLQGYICPAERIPRKLIPDEIKVMNPRRFTLRANSVYFFDDFHLVFPARRSYTSRNLFIDHCISKSGHYNSTFMFSTQISSGAEISAFRRCDAVFIKRPTMYSQSERSFVRDDAEKASKHFRALAKQGKNTKHYVYVKTYQGDEFEGMVGPITTKDMPDWCTNRELSIYLRKRSHRP